VKLKKCPIHGISPIQRVLTLRSLFKKPERILREMGIQKGEIVGGTTQGIEIGWNSFCYR